MKKIYGFLLVTIISLLVIAASAVTVFAADNSISAFSVSTDLAENKGDLGTVKWYKASDDVYYIFLSSSADRSEFIVDFEADADVYCGETKLVSGEKTDVFATGDEFVITCGDATYDVKVLQASKQGTIYINTESGSMSNVHADKNYKEEGIILILDENGNVEYEGDLDYIKGRGNTSWNQSKKPYNIKMAKKANLFGMGKSKKWSLIANATDPSMVRNELVYDMANNIGVNTTSYSHQVNLYLNGKYAGLYLLTEKVEIDENRVDIYDLEGDTEDLNEKALDEYPLAGKQNSQTWGTYKYADIPNNPQNITGGYLLELEKIYRYPNEASGFITDIGQAVVVKTPEYASKKQVEYISAYYQEFEDALYSVTGYNSSGNHYSEYIDVDSFARMYIVQEFTAIFDGCSSSFFLWKDIDGKITAGPAWDYDNSLGNGQKNTLINNVENTADPHLLFVQTSFIGNHAENRKGLLAQAFTHNDFQEKVEEIWATDFNNYFTSFYENIGDFSENITDSFVMNAVRWNTFGTTDIEKITEKHDKNTAGIYTYVDTRYAFLSNAYSADTCFVKYNVGEDGNSLVHDTNIYKTGDKVKILDGPEAGAFLKFSEWTDAEGKTYKPGDVITVKDNLVLTAKYESKSVLSSFMQMFIDFFNMILNLFKSILIF